jgi:hypothetical protein
LKRVSRTRYGCLQACSGRRCQDDATRHSGRRLRAGGSRSSLSRRAICDSASTRVYAQAVARPPSSATTAGRRLASGLHWHCTGTALAPKQLPAAILSPPPPVSLFPQSLSLFPSLRQLSCTCTTQRVPCVALPIAAFPARLRLPRPSSFELPPCALLNRIRLLLHWLPAARCALGTSRLRLALLLLFAACALLSHPSHPPGPPSPR